MRYIPLDQEKCHVSKDHVVYTIHPANDPSYKTCSDCSRAIDANDNRYGPIKDLQTKIEETEQTIERIEKRRDELPEDAPRIHGRWIMQDLWGTQEYLKKLNEILKIRLDELEQ